MSAKQDETKERRLAHLIRASQNGVRFGVIAGGRRDTPAKARR
jgi:hypothetical protein